MLGCFTYTRVENSISQLVQSTLQGEVKEKRVPGLKSEAGSVATRLAQWAYSFHYTAVFYCFIDQLTESWRM